MSALRTIGASFPGNEWAVDPASGATLFTDAELNNVVYALLKFVWEIDEPANAAIGQLLDQLGAEPLFEEVVTAVADHVQRTTGRVAAPDEIARRRACAKFVVRQFLLLPPNVRNDLGRDAAAFAPKRQ